MGVGGSSPDLVSRRTLGAAAVRPGRHSQGEGGGGGTNPDIHRTYDNLTNYDRGGGTGESMNKFSQKAYSTHSTEVRNLLFDYCKNLCTLIVRHYGYDIRSLEAFACYQDPSDLDFQCFVVVLCICIVFVELSD